MHPPPIQPVGNAPEYDFLSADPPFNCVPPMHVHTLQDGSHHGMQGAQNGMHPAWERWADWKSEWSTEHGSGLQVSVTFF
mmetsp:Transcript_39454/g.64097  ORF Transcript_39454/g.64097 Transcript_39454/m.64097 type:complete len:80 (-) Transcript_39454:81-320(-)|eukprot:CAMPEP_0174347376 /NCGR_PEP_ID=MMETSP0811_2-20130205/3433_1 /TAXON_ID=73025 ORGANISM="Eutreptiella gymnastica-like, Strain CCMP1594" /NCGR_SAMPLE_ID=MMETSP0811_2 /ASSEMBLY_ACC=CAM_ASM_000667 /LENGTH=79 /DNA_ID=CAMNT_0015472861 /DNA_START=598 /DNA_END=837 /DNA_ORIENTATION=-